MNEKIKKPIYKKWWFWLGIAVALSAISQSGKDGKSSGGSDNATQSTINLPIDQQKFIEITRDAQSKAKSAENDMQKGGIKNARDKELCAAIKSLQIKDWIGKIKEVEANSDGKGVLGIEISKDIKLKTWNNALSDISDSTLIEPGSQLFNTASQFKKGASVKFSGSLFRGEDSDCFKESSLTLSGKLREPEFIFRFEKISSN